MTVWRTKERNGTSIATHMVWDGTMLGLDFQLVQYVRNSPKGNLPLSLALYHCAPADQCGCAQKMDIFFTV